MKPDPDAPIPSIEPVPPEDDNIPVARLAALPFISNFNDLPKPLRFPNPVDVRNRQDFSRGFSADLSKDPFETRILNNGLQIGHVWPMEHKPRPPFFGDTGNKTVGWAEQMMADYFPGVNPYPQLRRPPGSSCLGRQHFAFLLMELYDAEGLMAQGQKLWSSHVMALLKWQLLDFQDIVFLHYSIIEYNVEPYDGFKWKKLTPDHQFIVLPVHLPDHWAVGIYHRATRRLGIVNTMAHKATRDSQYRILARVLTSYLKAGLPGDEGKDELILIKAKVSPQESATNCGWQVANYVTVFFRENRGKNNWEFGDWKDSNLAVYKPSGASDEEAMLQVWMFAIRSELNGTGQPLREPVNTPVIGYARYKRLVERHGIMSQEEIIARKEHSAAYIKNRPHIVKGRVPVEMAIAGLTERLNRVDLSRPIDHRASRSREHEGPSPKLNLKVGDLGPTREASVAGTLGLHQDLSKKPLLPTHADGNWSLEPDEHRGEEDLTVPVEDWELPEGPLLPQVMAAKMSEIGSGSPMALDQSPESVGRAARKTNKRHEQILRHNQYAHQWVGTRKAKAWVPMPAIATGHRNYAEVAEQAVRKIGERRRGNQKAERDERARLREESRVGRAT